MTDEQRETRDRILDTAEELFALEGFGAVSLRRIVGEAGVNLAAVHYYFGSKDGLIERLVERLVVPVNEERVRMMGAFRQESGGVLNLEQVVRAFVVPVFHFRNENGRDGKFVARLIGRLMTEYGEEMWSRMSRIFEPTVKIFIEAMKEIFPGARMERLYMALHFMAGLMAHSVGSAEFLKHGKCLSSDWQPTADQVIEDLIEFIKAGMEALIEKEK